MHIWFRPFYTKRVRYVYLYVLTVQSLEEKPTDSPVVTSEWTVRTQTTVILFFNISAPTNPRGYDGNHTRVHRLHECPGCRFSV